MSATTAERPPRSTSGPWPWLALVFSLGAHGVLYSMLGSQRIEAPPPQKPVDVEIVQVQKPPPPPPVKPPEPKKEEPPPPPKPIKIARARLPPPPKDMPPPPVAPPPPNQPPPKDDKPPPPINIGISLSSTISTGSFAAPVGNTLYGQAPDKAVDPHASKAYAAPAGPVHKFVPSYAVTEPPSIEVDYKPPYPEEARKQGLEAQVTLQLTLDDMGKVVKARVVQPAGHGFDEAAVEGAHHFRFKPARLNGQAVATEINYTITFLLD